jgi:hypothetical protein
MGEYKPYGGFKWYEGDLNRSQELLDGTTEKSDVGRIYEVIIAYPDSLTYMTRTTICPSYLGMPYHRARKLINYLPRWSKKNDILCTIEI